MVFLVDVNVVAEVLVVDVPALVVSDAVFQFEGGDRDLV